MISGWLCSLPELANTLVMPGLDPGISLSQNR